MIVAAGGVDAGAEAGIEDTSRSPPRRSSRPGRTCCSSCRTGWPRSAASTGSSGSPAWPRPRPAGQPARLAYDDLHLLGLGPRTGRRCAASCATSTRSSLSGWPRRSPRGEAFPRPLAVPGRRRGSRAARRSWPASPSCSSRPCCSGRASARCDPAGRGRWPFSPRSSGSTSASPSTRARRRSSGRSACRGSCSALLVGGGSRSRRRAAGRVPQPAGRPRADRRLERRRARRGGRDRARALGSWAPDAAHRGVRRRARRDARRLRVRPLRGPDRGRDAAPHRRRRQRDRRRRDRLSSSSAHRRPNCASRVLVARQPRRRDLAAVVSALRRSSPSA